MANDTRTQIWYVIGSLQVGGAERNLLDLANRLDSDEFDVTVWTLLPRDPLADELNDNIQYQSLAASGKFDAGAALRFFRAVRQRKPDILHSFLYFDNVLARLAGTVSPATTVISSVMSVPTSPSAIRATVDRCTMPLCDHVVTNSEDGATLAHQRSASTDNVTVILNGRDIKQFQTANAPLDLRSSLGIPADARVVGTVGRLVPVKGHRDLLAAWPQIHEAHPDTHLLFVGDGPKRKQLEAKAARERITDSVTFTGVRSDVSELLSAMDVFVFPSHYEGMPGAVIEAMAAGLPIIGTRVVGTTEVIDDGETGLLVPAKEPAELATGIKRILSDNELAKKLGEKASSIAEDRFSLESMLSSYTDLYRQIEHSDN